MDPGARGLILPRAPATLRPSAACGVTADGEDSDLRPRAGFLVDGLMTETMTTDGSVFDVLRAQGALRGLSDDEVRVLAGCAEPRECPAGAWLFRENQPRR